MQSAAVKSRQQQSSSTSLSQLTQTTAVAPPLKEFPEFNDGEKDYVYKSYKKRIILQPPQQQRLLSAKPRRVGSGRPALI